MADKWNPEGHYGMSRQEWAVFVADDATYMQEVIQEWQCDESNKKKGKGRKGSQNK